MKLLTFVDLHGDISLLNRLIKRGDEEDINLIIGAGDLTQFEGNLGYILKKLDALGKKVLVIPGNHESEKGLKEGVRGCENCEEFNRKAVKFGEYIILGYGGGGFALEDGEFRRLAREWYGNYQREKIILVTHGPPFGTALDRVGNRYVGNKDFRAFIERIKPKLVICGHLHETAGKKDKIGETIVVNPGWEGMAVELG